MPVQFAMPSVDSAFGSLVPELAAAASAAAQEWASYIVGNARLNIHVVYDPTATAWGRSRAACRLAGWSSSRHNVSHVVVEATACAIKNPDFPQPAGHSDILIGISPIYLTDLVFSRSSPLQTTQRDAHSLLLHEIGHSLGFNGRLHQTTGAASEVDGVSLYDECVIGGNGRFRFVGNHARLVYGGDVPLGGNNNYHHVDHPDPVMTAQSMDGRRFSITELDRAILRDTGLDIR